MSEDRNFREVFKQQHDNIKSQIESGGHTQESILKNIEELQKRVQQRRDKLAKFDHEFYGSSLQKLRESVWKQRKPAKVTFKAKIGKPKATTGSQLATSVTSEPLSLKTGAILKNQLKQMSQFQTCGTPRLFTRMWKVPCTSITYRILGYMSGPSSVAFMILKTLLFGLKNVSVPF